MPLYNYEAMDEAGLLLSGVLEAEDERAAVRHLRAVGHTVLELNTAAGAPWWRAWGRGGRVGLTDLVFFSRQLAAMLQAGISLSRCLLLLHRQTTHPVLRRALVAVAGNVESGSSLSDSLRSFPAIFNPVYVAVIKAGEISGSLVEVLTALAAQLGREKTLRDQMRSATLYPLLILLFSAAVVFCLIFFLVPILKTMLPPELPLQPPTRIVFGVSDALHVFWYAGPVLAAGSALILRAYLRSQGGPVFLEQLKYRLPIFGALFKKTVMVRFIRVFALMLNAGIPILQALEAAGAAAGSINLHNLLQRAGQEVEEGRALAAALTTVDYFPALVLNLMAVGEETGRLPLLLDQAADFFEEEVAVLTKGLVTLIEPLLIIVLGLIVGLVIISIYLPLFFTVTAAGA